MTLRLDLPAGRYRVESQIGSQNARIVRDIELGAGDEKNLIFEHSAANVRLKLMEAGGGFLSNNAFWEIRDSSGNIVSRTTHGEPRVLLAAGRYKVRIETRERRFERAFEIKAGESRTLEFTSE
jgi:hypothetical protein